jgi:serine/threonine protein phosphatase 1
MNTVLHLPKNTVGRDLIIGDLHGCYDELWHLLKHIDYNSEQDRILFVGDLIDRGPKSELCFDMVQRNNVYSTLGNHEEMMFQAVLNLKPSQYDVWMANGGGWARELFQDWLPAFQAKLIRFKDKFPLVIVVGEGEDRFNVVHAEFYSGKRPLSNKDIDDWTFTPEEINNMIWGRTLIQYATSNDHLFQYNMSTTYVGHTPTRAVLTSQSQIFIDQGCCFAVNAGQGRNADSGLTIVCHQDKKYWTLHPSDGNRVSQYDLPPIRW